MGKTSAVFFIAATEEYLKFTKTDGIIDDQNKRKYNYFRYIKREGRMYEETKEHIY